MSLRNTVQFFGKFAVCKTAALENLDYVVDGYCTNTSIVEVE